MTEETGDDLTKLHDLLENIQNADEKASLAPAQFRSMLVNLEEMLLKRHEHIEEVVDDQGSVDLVDEEDGTSSGVTRNSSRDDLTTDEDEPVSNHTSRLRFGVKEKRVDAFVRGLLSPPYNYQEV
jgi:hypothetical protein